MSIVRALVAVLCVIACGTAVAGTFDLAAAANSAQVSLTEHQQADGYWLTSYTRSTQFTAPKTEMNTFVTSVIVDLLSPLDQAQTSVTRARRHLTNQIEASGLVRYHGLPNAPSIGKLGIVITPDTDDTALVWRIAPGSDLRQRDAALTTIENHRTTEGLYRTWLAPREAFQGIDPGSDPNPTDLCINMHLLLLFAKVKPASATALCAALQPLLDEDRLWVYYRQSPLVAMLRLPELKRSGCDMKLPAKRLVAADTDQEMWLSAVRLLSGTGDPTTLLEQLAKDDFALLRKHPPLLYHNDLSAKVSRYYWSEDIGYALWLRLYQRHKKPSH